MLLVQLAAEWPGEQSPVRSDGWEDWKDGWEGIRRNSTSLRLIAAKMKKNLLKGAIGPAPLAFMGRDRWISRYKASVSAHGLLSSFVGVVECVIPALEAFSDMHRAYLRELRASRYIRRQEDATIALLWFIKEHTGRCWFARVTVLINLSRSVTGAKKLKTEESLRRLWDRRPK